MPSPPPDSLPVPVPVPPGYATRFLESISEAVLLLDRECRFLYANRRMGQMAGCSAAEMVGKSIWEFFPHCLDSPFGRDVRRTLLERTVTEGENPCVSTARWARYRAEPVEDGVMITVQDISEQKHAEEAQLRRSEAHFRQMVHSVAVGILVAELDGTITDANPAFCRMLGRDLEWLRGRSLVELSSLDSQPAARTRLAELAAGRSESFHVQEQCLAADGSPVDTEWTISVVHDPEGTPRGCICAVDDVTAARRFQEALRQSEEQLRQMQKMEAIGRLAGGVAHDFNNMLAVINGYSEMLLPLTADGTPLHRGLTEIKSAGERSAALTRQLLAFSRKQVLRARVLDLGEVVRGLSGMLRRLIGEDVDLRLHVDEDLGRVRADAGQLEQVVLNLAVNARDAMPQGGTLEIRLRNRDVAPDHARAAHLVAGQYVEMVVADTGHGMEPEIRDRIFEPFFTTKRPGEGTGLGLSTVYGIVRQSEGDVEVESRIGSGTTFRILLPRAAGYEAATPPGPVAALRGGHETILLVEDEEMVRGLVREVLIHQGYRVLEARDAAEARRVSESLEDPLHLLLTDVVMPGDSGCDLARDLHRQRPDLRVLYMSGYTQETVARRGIEEPDFAFIQKPFEPAALVAQVRAVLSAPPRDA